MARFQQTSPEPETDDRLALFQRQGQGEQYSKKQLHNDLSLFPAGLIATNASIA